MKIKGWKKVKDTKNKIGWSNNETILSVVTPFPEKRFLLRWKVYGQKGLKIKMNTTYNHTKKEAIQIAYKYMKSHPRG